ncbi:hypothetical protein L083_6557 [Actinoplanes sp. N902-109]|nr:hypothetical protein L083_6557 [Actinoplanes sp. N902-109]
MLRSVVAVLAVATFAGCSSDDDPKPDTSKITADTMRAALLTPADIGPTWKTPPESPAPATLVSICGADTAAAGIPGKPAVLTAPVSDEGTAGVQSLTQYALIYDDAVSASTAVATLRTIADACPASVQRPAKEGDRDEPAYTETAKTTELEQAAWAGFATTRNKQYDKAHPATADIAVVALSHANVVLVDQYAIYRLGKSAVSANPQFSQDWQKLVGTTLSRVP